MKVYRSIYVNDLSEIDLKNLGCHWTASANYAHVGGGSNGTTVIKRLKVKFEVEVEVSSVNKEATELSREWHPHEKEIVTLPNVAATANMVVVDTKTRKFVNGFRGETVKINTGTRVDKWVEEMK